MEVQYSLEFVYQAIGKLYVEAEAYKQQLARLQADARESARAAKPADTAGPAMRELRQASSEGQGSPEEAAPVPIPIPPAPERLADRSKPHASA